MNIEEKIKLYKQVTDLAKELNVSDMLGVKDLTPYIWCMDRDNAQLWWNEENEVDDLLDNDGETLEANNVSFERENNSNYVTATIQDEDSGLFDVKILLDLSKRVKME